MAISPLMVRRNAPFASASISREYYCGGVARGKGVGVIAMHAYPYYMKLYICIYGCTFTFFFTAAARATSSMRRYKLKNRLIKSPSVYVNIYIQIYECNCTRCVYKSYNRKVKRIGILHVVVVRI